MLSKKIRYLQIALNSTLSDASYIISNLPVSDRIILEAGTPLIKEYGGDAIRHIKSEWDKKTFFNRPTQPVSSYIVADMKCMDRGEREVAIAANAGASAVIALGAAPIETLNIFIENCEKWDVDSMIDMMNIEEPYKILRKLKKYPKVVILHRGVDEESVSNKMLPIHMINKVKGSYDIMISIAGGDKPREIQSAVFNGADIVVLWKDFYTKSTNTLEIVEEFLKNIK